MGCAKLGFGLHYWNVNPANAQRIIQLYYAVQMLYIIVLILAKVSIVALFARVFPSRKFQLVNRLVFVFLVGHGLVFTFVIMFECTPIAGIWDRTLIRKCVDLNAVALASAILSIVEDIVILAMPIQQLSQLQLGSKKKLAVIFMFSLGSFLPALRPLFKKIPGLLTTIRGPTVEIKETHDRGSSHMSLRDKGVIPMSPKSSSTEPDVEEDMIIIHISNDHDPRMKPLPPPPLQPLTYQPPWRGSGSVSGGHRTPSLMSPSLLRSPRTPRTPMTPMTPGSLGSIRREADAEYEMDLRSIVNTKTWM
ncbi:hypothetical protein CBS470a_003955 [Colletotrichum nupharicola]|nr:hypothetical protein CBS470a_003955 [Colletotrichum nupharicola]